MAEDWSVKPNDTLTIPKKHPGEHSTVTAVTRYRVCIYVIVCVRVSVCAFVTKDAKGYNPVKRI